MTSYKDSGVDITAGNDASRIAYTHAKSTFASRSGKIGAPVTEDGGFAGMLDMGDFFLVQNDDGTGSKMDLALAMNTFDTIGYDLLAMVVDDAICTGAEVISVSNTLDVSFIDSKMIDSLLSGLSKACSEQQIVIPGGEIAEVPGAVNSPVWNATSVGVVAKDKVIDGKSITEGDSVIALQSGVARSNGFSLIRKILKDTQGPNWFNEVWRGQTWGEIMLTPSVIYHGALLRLLGRHGEKRKVNIKGIAHVTGGGIAENLKRTLKASGTGAILDNLFAPHDALKDLIELGNVAIDEAYKTWNMGNGMLVIVDASDVDTVISELKLEGITAQLAGSITRNADVQVTAFDGSILA